MEKEKSISLRRSSGLFIEMLARVNIWFTASLVSSGIMISPPCERTFPPILNASAAPDTIKISDAPFFTASFSIFSTFIHNCDHFPEGENASLLSSCVLFIDSIRKKLLTALLHDGKASIRIKNYTITYEDCQPNRNYTFIKMLLTIAFFVV